MNALKKSTEEREYVCMHENAISEKGENIWEKWGIHAPFPSLQIDPDEDEGEMSYYYVRSMEEERWRFSDNVLIQSGRENDKKNGILLHKW